MQFVFLQSRQPPSPLRSEQELRQSPGI